MLNAQMLSAYCVPANGCVFGYCRSSTLTFFASRLCAVPIAIDVLRQCESPLTFYPLLAGVAGLVYDNVRTLLRMRYHARQAAAGGGVAEHGSWPL